MVLINHVSSALYTSESQYTFRQKVTTVTSRRFMFGFKIFFKMASHGSAISEQIDTLLNFLNEFKDLARGSLRSVEGNVQTKRMWAELCNIGTPKQKCSAVAKRSVLLASQPAHPGRRHSAAGTVVTSRLFQYEEGSLERETKGTLSSQALGCYVRALWPHIREYLDRQ